MHKFIDFASFCPRGKIPANSTCELLRVAAQRATFLLTPPACEAISLRESLGVFAPSRETALKDNPFIYVSTHNCDIELKKRLDEPHVNGARLHGDLNGCYKIKLRKVGYRLVSSVENDTLVVLVLSINRREGMLVYKDAAQRRD